MKQDPSDLLNNYVLKSIIKTNMVKTFFYQYCDGISVDTHCKGVSKMERGGI